MNKSLMLMFLSFIFNNNLSAEIATGELEEFFISNSKNDRKVRIYYPSNNPINEETTFIIMNDGEELFLEQDSWNGKSWRIDKSFDQLNKKNIEHNTVIVAVHSAKDSKEDFLMIREDI